MQKRLLVGWYLLLLFAACKGPSANIVERAEPENIMHGIIVDSINVVNDSTREVTKKLGLVYCYFNDDNIADTILIGKPENDSVKVLVIKYGGTGERFILRSGEQFGESFKNFNWVDELRVIKKGTKIFNNIDSASGDMIGADEVPESKKIKLNSDAILVHVAESCGGGIIYLDKGKYHWVTQD